MTGKVVAGDAVFCESVRRVFVLRKLACRSIGVLLVGQLSLAATGLSHAQQPGFVNFESPQAKSLAISRDGGQLLAVNTPANSLVVFSLQDPKQPTPVFEIPVGLDPIALAVRSPREVWVLNHVSDSISVVDLERRVVVETIQVGDRPGDIVFAGDGGPAFVSSMTEKSLHVIDSETRSLLSTIPIPAHSPRAMLASPDGSTLWVASYLSGNRTTVIPQALAPSPPDPEVDDLPDAPAQGIIVSTDDSEWKETLDFELADEDIFEIDVENRSIRGRFARVGTILFGLARHPVSNELWVANTEARNLVRFEPTLKGHFVDNRVSRLATGPNRRDNQDVFHHDLNAEIDFSQLPSDSALSSALAQPTDIVFSASGARAYVAAFGTDRIGIMNEHGEVVGRIEIGDASGSASDPKNKRGPRSLVIHPNGRWLFVLNRLSNSLSVVDTIDEQAVAEVMMSDPTPEFIRAGRGYLFDAKLSGNGTASCASCHVDGDRDGLAWDLGDPAGELFKDGTARPLHPMKGPLLTQTLRGLAGERLFHWRADRPGLESFNGTFENLLAGEQLSESDLALFVEYLQSIRFAPNPRREWDGSFAVDENGRNAADGELLFRSRFAIGREGDNVFRCVDCHMRPNGAGTSGFTGLIGQSMKVAQLRGMLERDAFAGDGSRVSGFGYGADGSKPTLREFLADSHRFDGIADWEKVKIEQFLLAFPTESPAIVGSTRTLHAQNLDDSQLESDLEMMMNQAANGNCRLVVSGMMSGMSVRWVYDANIEKFVSHDPALDAKSFVQIWEAISGEESFLSFLATPIAAQE